MSQLIIRFSLLDDNLYEYDDHVRLYLLGVYYTIVTITTVGFGDITPSNQSKQNVTKEEKVFVCLLLIVGVVFYSNTMSLFATLFVDENSRMKNRLYNVLLELKNMGFIEKRLTMDISKIIETMYSENDVSRAKNWLHLTDEVEMKQKIFVGILSRSDDGVHIQEELFIQYFLQWDGRRIQSRGSKKVQSDHH